MSGAATPMATFNAPNSTITAGRDNNFKFYTVNGDLIADKAPNESLLHRLRTTLGPVDAARHDSYEAKRREECFPNTRVQVLNEIEAWITQGGHQASIYVLDGVAGIGKSTIAQTIAVKADKLGFLGASFCFSRDDAERMVAKHFFSTIAYQLGCYDGQFATRIIQALDKDPDAPRKRLYQQFLLLWQQPLRDPLLQRTKPTLIVVDALDECEEEDAQELLSLLGQYAHRLSGLKFFITTRPERHLRRILDQDESHERFRLHDIESSIVHADIRLYLESKLSTAEVCKVFRNLRTPWQPSVTDMNVLCGLCGTLFIIAATATKFILDSHASPQTQLSRLLKGVFTNDFTGSQHTDVLDATYLRIIFATQSELDEIDEDWLKSLNKILGSLIILANPLPCEALATLLEIPPDDLEAVLSNLHSLVAPSGSGANTTFRIHHKSFPDFMSSRERIRRVLRKQRTQSPADLDHLLWIDVDSHHLQLAKACLRVMNCGLKWNMANINEADRYQDKNKISHVVSELIPRELAYSVLYWASHLYSSRKIGADVELQEYLNDWASTHIMHWIEVMIILDQGDKLNGILQDAITSIRTVTGAVWPQREQVEYLLSDTARFVQQGSEVMKISPMHIYRSCLPFTPTETPLYHVYGIQTMLQIGMERSTQWDSCLVTYVGHSDVVDSVAFSNDGSYLASGSGDYTTRLWDTKTGAHIQTLVGHKGWVLSVAFLSNGCHLVSGAANGTIWLWDVKTSEGTLALALLDGSTEVEVESVACSNDGTQVAFGFDDSAVRLWDVKTGVHIYTLIGHSDTVETVAFSRDDSQLASGSGDDTIRIWDAKTGGHIITLIGHSDRVNSVVFSNNALHLASGSDDSTVRLWDTKTGVQIHECLGHSSIVFSVTFSSDDSKLASGSRDKTIRLWDAKTGAHMSTLLGHSNSVISVAFSNDGLRLASGSSDSTVRLWEPSTKTCHHAHDSSQFAAARHSNLVTSVAFSEDGSRLASGSWDRTVGLWDSTRGVLISTLFGHSASVSSVAISSDNSRVASGSHDKTVRLWNTESGTQVLILTGHSGYVCSVALSKDGLQLASGSEDKTIRVWNTRMGIHTFTLTGHQDWIHSVAFSHDGLRLASGSDDKTVRLWDTNTGALIHTLTDHSYGTPPAVAFSANDSQLASTHGDQAFLLWDVKTGALESILTSAAFSPIYKAPAVFLTFDGGIGDTNSPSLLLLVQRKSPFVTGLVRASRGSGPEWEIDPLCWFPPDMKAKSFVFYQPDCRAAVGFENGQVIVIDFSSERFRFS